MIISLPTMKYAWVILIKVWPDTHESFTTICGFFLNCTTTKTTKGKREDEKSKQKDKKMSNC